MRLMLTLEPLEDFPENSTGKHAVSSMLYSYLTGTRYEELHDRKGFKFFTFSDLFPPGDFKAGEPKHLIVSSPDDCFIETLYEKLQPVETVLLGRHTLRLVSMKKFRLRPSRRFVTGSPVVVRTLNGGYFTFIHHADLDYFINRLTENAVRKYRTFTGEDFELDGPLFTYMIPRVRKNGMIDVFVEMKIHGRSFQVAGSTWKLLEAPVNGDNRNFYAFIMDSGIGELNPHGFGLINPIKRHKSMHMRG